MASPTTSVLELDKEQKNLSTLPVELLNLLSIVKFLFPLLGHGHKIGPFLFQSLWKKWKRQQIQPETHL